MTDDEVAPKTMLYPRDPSLDPQLVWKGKDEQDRHPLEVPVVPIYIQEKIRPQSHRAGRVEQASRLRFGRIAWSRRPACGLGGRPRPPAPCLALHIYYLSSICMDRSYDSLRDEVLQLDRDSQRRLADEIEDRLAEPHDEIDEAWSQEIKRRLDAHRRGEGSSVTAEESIANARKHLEEAKRARGWL